MREKGTSYFDRSPAKNGQKVLRPSFTEIGEQFKTDSPGNDIEFSFAGSSDLVTQLTQGAPADVFASVVFFAKENQPIPFILN